MRGWMTNRHEGCVSTMLTDKRLEYCTAGAPLQGSGATKWRMHADKHGDSGVFRLDNAQNDHVSKWRLAILWEFRCESRGLVSPFSLSGESTGWQLGRGTTGVSELSILGVGARPVAFDTTGSS